MAQPAIGRVDRKMTFRTVRYGVVPNVVSGENAEVRLRGLVANAAAARREGKMTALAVRVPWVSPAAGMVGRTGFGMARDAEIGSVAGLATRPVNHGQATMGFRLPEKGMALGFLAEVAFLTKPALVAHGAPGIPHLG